MVDSRELLLFINPTKPEKKSNFSVKNSNRCVCDDAVASSGISRLHVTWKSADGIQKGSKNVQFVSSAFLKVLTYIQIGEGSEKLGLVQDVPAHDRELA